MLNRDNIVKPRRKTKRKKEKKILKNTILTSLSFIKNDRIRWI